MFGFKLIHAQSARKFKYSPRFYDPDKEELEMRKKEILGSRYEEENEGEYKPGQYIREMRIRRGIVADRRKKELRTVRMRRLLIFLLLGGVVLFFLLKMLYAE